MRIEITEVLRAKKIVEDETKDRGKRYTKGSVNRSLKLQEMQYVHILLQKVAEALEERDRRESLKNL